MKPKFSYKTYGLIEGGKNNEYKISERDECGATVAVYRGFYNNENSTFVLYPVKRVQYHLSEFITKKRINARDVKPV